MVDVSFLVALFGYLVVAICVGIVIGWLFWGGEPFEATSAVAGSTDDERHSELSAQVEAREQEIARLRKRLKRVHADLDSRDTHVTASKAAQEELAALLRERETELDMLRQQHDMVLASGLGGSGVHPLVAAPPDESMLRRLSELEEDLAASRSELTRVHTVLDDVTVQRDRALEVATKPASPQDAGSDRASDEKIALLQRALEDAEAARDAATKRAAELEAAYEKVSAELAENQGGADEVSARATATAREVDELTRRLTESEALVAERDAALASLKEHVTTLESQPASTSSSTIDTEAADELRLELSKVQTELGRSRQSVATLRQRVQEVEDENETLAGDLAKSNAELTSRSSRTAEAAAENERLLAETNRLRTGVLGLDERAKKAEADLEKALHDVQAAQQELQSIHETHSTELSSLRTELTAAQTRAAEAHQSLQDLTRDFIDFREVTTRQQSSMQALSERLDKARTSLVSGAAGSSGDAARGDQSDRPTAGD